MEGEPSPNGYNVKRLVWGVLIVVVVLLALTGKGDHIREWRLAIVAVLVVATYIRIALRKPDEKS